VFTAAGAEVLTTPVRTPVANSYAERWVRTAREECLDWTLIFNRRNLQHVLDTHVRHYNEGRPHRGIGLEVPVPVAGEVDPTAAIECVDILGGLIHQYARAA
jgi:transposase InsO family protein